MARRVGAVFGLTIIALMALSGCGGDDKSGVSAPNCGQSATEPNLSGNWSATGCGGTDTCQIAQNGSKLTWACSLGDSCDGVLCQGGKISLNCSDADGQPASASGEVSADGQTIALSVSYSGGKCNAILNR